MPYRSIQEQVQQMFKESQAKAMSEAQMDAMRQQIQSEQTGIGDYALDALKAAGGAALWTLDAPRRGIQALGWAAAGRDWADAWELAENGANILTEGLGYENPEDSWGSWGAGLALDIVTDPLMYFGVGTLTQSGKAAKKTGKLGLTWAKQAEKGQRAALTLWTPWETLSVIDSPAFVRAEAALGQKVANAPIIKGLVRAFTTKSLDPRVRKLVDDALAQAPDDLVDVFKWRDEQVHGILAQVAPDDILDVVSLAEASGKRGGWAKKVIADADNWSPLKRAQGHQLAQTMAAAESLANSKGVGGEVLGAAIVKRVRNLDQMDKKAWDALEKAHKSKVLNLERHVKDAVDKAKWLDGDLATAELKYNQAKSKAGKALAIMNGQRDELFRAKQMEELGLELHDEAIDSLLASDVAKAKAKSAKTLADKRSGVEKLLQDPKLQAEDIGIARSEGAKATRLKGRVQPLYAQSREAFAEAAKSRSAADEMTPQIVEKWQNHVAELKSNVQKLRAEATHQHWLSGHFLGTAFNLKSRGTQATKEMIWQGKKLATARAAQDNLPNWIPRSMTTKARAHLKAMGVAGKDNARVWHDKALGKFEREMGERLFIGKKEYMRPWSIPEITKAIQEAGPAGSLERWRGFIDEPDGVFGFIDKIFKRPKDLRKMYNLDPIGMINKVSDQMAQAIKSKQLFETLKQSDELFSKEALPGWIHVRQLGEDALKSIGDGYITPDAFQELRRVYTNLTNPDNRTILGEAWNKFTKYWKWSVTRIFPAYHARNHFEDTIRMIYNGPFNPIEVHENMVKGLAKKGKIKLGSNLVDIEDAWRLAEANGVVNTGEVAVGSIRRSDGTWRTIDRAADAIFQAPEDGRRFGYWVERINKGFSHFQASQEVKRVLFDYSDLSKFERGVMSQIVPFYTYMKNTLRLHAQTAIQNPGMLMGQKRVIEALKGDHAPEDIPQWARSRLFIAAGVGERTGEERLVSAYGLPLQDIMELLDGSGGFNDWVKQLAWRAHPVIRFPFRVGAASEADRPGYAPQVFKHLPQSVKDMMGVRAQKAKDGGEYVTIDPIYATLLDTVGSRFYSTVKSLGRSDSSAGQQTLRHLLGINVVDYDPKVEKRRQERNEFEDLIGRMVRRGDLGRIPGFYKPQTSQLDEKELLFLRAKKKALGK